ncbi:MAG TPA: Fe-S cluster assembly ATPase SufC [Rhodospirillaceae bacterium]|jgi:Fe-S cluster assembly ATP-binding protein|nr:Fe-S cluster assembly ATPase SufC [Alphaproteobacteria bacterium]HBH25987.1 Fe-S cluster assembly ATPase SufC [Rhodospirillaceae bacterium]
MLHIDNLHAAVDGKAILNGLTLHVPKGQVHAVMGPNGSGKSTLAYVLAGRPGYEVTDGTAALDGQNILAMEPEERAAAGLFLAFQYPVEVPGVGFMTFLKTAINAQRAARGEEPMPALDLLKSIRKASRALGIGDDMLGRAVNAGFSGGEKKRAEVLQMALLGPRCAILDETDSGLDVDALKTVADGVNALRSPDRAFLIITHYQRLLDHIVPDRVHVLSQGRIARSGGPDLAQEVEAQGYGAA